MANSTISYLWRDQRARKVFVPAFHCTAIPTSPRRRWSFLANIGSQFPMMRPAAGALERRGREPGMGCA